jgi:spore maturation protein CgeB
MKIIIVGAWFTNIYEEPLAVSFKKEGHEVHEFRYSKYFHNAHLKYYQTKPLKLINKIYYLLQNKYIMGPTVDRINQDLIDLCAEINADIIIFYRAIIVRRQTILQIKNVSQAKLISYHNDDPFIDSKRHENRNYISALDLMDCNYVYRKKNIIDVRKYSKHCDILLPYPNSDFIFPLKNCKKKYDVVFIGHYERDGRDRIIWDLINDKSVNFKLFGTDWHKSPFYEDILNKMGVIKPVYCKNYNLILNNAKIALCFFSKLNNDQYTRRTFEIPAAGTTLLSQYSNESAALLKPDVEAIYFNSSTELLEKTHFYLRYDKERNIIAENGYRKVIYGGHTSLDRVKQILKDIKSK